MAKYQVTAPDKTTGKIVGVVFVEGVATVDEKEQRPALAYFRRHDGYQVEETGAASEEKTSGHPARSASKSDWVAYATSEAGGNRFSVEDAEKLTRDQLAEKYLGPKES